MGTAGSGSNLGIEKSAAHVERAEESKPRTDSAGITLYNPSLAVEPDVVYTEEAQGPRRNDPF